MRLVSISYILCILVIAILLLASIPNLDKIGQTLLILSYSCIINEKIVNICQRGDFFKNQWDARYKPILTQVKFTKNRDWTTIPNGATAMWQTNIIYLYCVVVESQYQITNSILPRTESAKNWVKLRGSTMRVVKTTVHHTAFLSYSCVKDWLWIINQLN